MSSKKVFQTLVLSFVFICTIFCKLTKSKSVYVITDHGYRIYYPYNAPAKISAYGIDSGHIDFQKTLTLDQSEYPTGQFRGPVGLAIDSESGYMFVTHESVEGYGGLEGIQLINAKTMVDEGVIEVPGAPDLAGIVFDNERQKVYTVERGTNKLFVLLWDAQNKTLILEGGQTKTLAEIGNFACGLALDEIDDILYVTSLIPHSTAVSNVVHYYDVNDPNWTHQGSVEIVVDSNDRKAVGIAVYNDGQGSKYLYTGAWGSHNYLVRTDINDINNPSSTEKDIGTSVIGVAVDNDNGLVYVTTYNNHIEVYNPAAWPSDPCCIEDANIIGPAGICVPTSDVSYKPPFPLLTLVKDDNDVNCAYHWNEIDENYLVYNICYDANGHADTNVYITDTLPAEVNFISCDPNNGVYDPDMRTVTWYIPIMSSSDSNTYRIQVAVNYYAKPGHKIFNLCEIESDLYYMFTTLETDVCCYGGNIFYVDANASVFNNGTSWPDAYNDLQDALHTARTCGCQQIWVAEGMYKPTKAARSISFDLVDNVAIYGGFPPGGGAWIQRNPNTYETILSGDIGIPVDQNDNSYHVVKAVDINNAILDGFDITAGMANGSGDDGYGGGLYFKDSNNLTLKDCNVSANLAKYGGGMYNEVSSSTIIDCIFTANTAEYYAGVMYNYWSSPSVINCTFSGNSTTATWNTYGGAIYNTTFSEPNVTNCTFSNNSAHEGGAVYNYDSDPNIINCIFKGNKAKVDGGGLYNYDSDPKITSCIFSDNTAKYYGGGIFKYSTITLRL